MEVIVFRRLELGVVHLLADIDHLLEVIHYFIEVVERKICMTDVNDHVQYFLLTFHRSNRIHFIECILLQDYKVYQFRLQKIT